MFDIYFFVQKSLVEIKQAGVILLSYNRKIKTQVFFVLFSQL